MRDIAVVFTAYNRTDYLEQTLQAWSKVNNIDKFDIYFSVEPSDKVEDIKKMLKDFGDKVYSNVHVKYNKELMGCAKNTWSSLDYLFSKYNFVILAEDDILPSKDIVDYFIYLENKYRDVSDVAVISASNRAGESDPTFVAKTPGFPGLIWGTWAKYWNKYFKDTWDFDYSTGTEENPQSGWDWNLTLRVMPQNNLWSIYPVASRSQHIGVNGIHCDENIFEETTSISFKENHEWKDLVEV